MTYKYFYQYMLLSNIHTYLGRGLKSEKINNYNYSYFKSTTEKSKTNSLNLAIEEIHKDNSHNNKDSFSEIDIIHQDHIEKKKYSCVCELLKTIISAEFLLQIYKNLYDYNNRIINKFSIYLSNKCDKINLVIKNLLRVLKDGSIEMNIKNFCSLNNDCLKEISEILLKISQEEYIKKSSYSIFNFRKKSSMQSPLIETNLIDNKCKNYLDLIRIFYLKDLEKYESDYININKYTELKNKIDIIDYYSNHLKRS